MPFANYFDDWKTREHKCACGWVGQGSALNQGELFDELAEFDCPECHETVLLVVYPTIDDYRANWDKLDDNDRRYVEKHDQFREQFQREKLRSPGDLPDVSASSFILSWDCGGDEVSLRTLITLGDRVIFSEPAVYEGYERFAEVARILKVKYGSRLKDVIPTERSWTYLYGDEGSALDFVEDIRRTLFS